MLAPASETIRSPRGEKAKPNGTAPAEAVTTGAPMRPKRSGNVSIRLDWRSVTTRSRPPGATETCAAPSAPAVEVGGAARAQLAGAVEVEAGDVRRRRRG